MIKKQKFFKATVILFIFWGPILVALSINQNWTWKSQNSPTPPPTANFTFTLSGECSDQPVKFENTSTGADLSYSWNFGDPNSENNLSTSENPTHIFVGSPGNGTQNFQVTLTVEDSTGLTHFVIKTISLTQIPSLAVGSDQEGSSFDNLPYYIICENSASEFTFYNHSTTRSTNIKYEIDWGDGSPQFEGDDWDSFTHTYDQGIYKIIYTITGENGCVATKTYGVFVGSNPAVGFGNPGNTNICTGEELSFPITGADNNPVGTIYTVTYSDGSDPEIFTHPPPASVSHIFESSSCGETNSSRFPNSFSATITAANPCSASSATVAPIYATEAPVPDIELPTEAICVDSPVNIQNITVYGNEVSSNGNCTDQGKFVWEITPSEGWILSSGSLGTLTDPQSPNSWMVGSPEIRPIFTEPGNYTITLISGNRCGIQEKEEILCVIPEPFPAFSLDLEEGCGPLQVKTENESNTLGSCGPSTFEWKVIYASGECGDQAGWDFAPGSNINSRSPGFIFTDPGEYTIHLSIKSGCGVFVDEKSVSVYAPPTAVISPIEDFCGPIIIQPSADVRVCDIDEPVYLWTFEGGVPSSSTLRDPGEIEFATPGEKSITLKITTSCGTTVATENFRVHEPPVVDFGPDLVICNGEEITLSPNVSPSGDYSYLWTSLPGGSLSNPNIAIPTASPNQTTVYTLTVTNQSTGCQTTDTITVDVLPSPIVVFSIPDQTICSGETALPVSLTSLPAGASIRWTSLGTDVIGVETEGTAEIPEQTLINESLLAQQVVYTAEIISSDQGACTVVPSSYTITVNPVPRFENEEIEICSGNQFEYTPNGHSAGILYTWSAIPTEEITGSTAIDIPQASLAQNLKNNGNSPARITYVVTPILGECPGEPFELDVTVQPSPGLHFSVPDQMVCSGGSTEEVLIESDVPGAFFSWVAIPNGIQGAVLSGSSNIIPVQNLSNPTDQPIVVEYRITGSINEESTCSGSPEIYTITVNPSIRVSPTISEFSGFQISCFGANDGLIRINPSGGDGNYQVSWAGPDGFTSGSQDIDNLAPGTYELNFEDGSGCQLVQTFEITQPEPLSAQVLSITEVLCAGESTGEISIDIKGGISPYSFDWSRDGLPLDVRSQNLTDMPAGNYLVTIRDSHECAVTLPLIEVREPEVALSIGVEKRNISCYNANDGFIEIEIIGGISPYQILWDFGSTQTSFENLGPGIYTVTVLDNVGCALSLPIEIVDAPLFRISPEIKNISCHGNNDGSIQLNLEGMGPDVSIRWDHGSELESLFNLEAGDYGVTITRPDNCLIREEFSIIEPDALVLESQITDALDCLNPQSGAIQLAVSGGTPPFQYTWSDGQMVQNLSGLSSGQYGIEVEDASGCRISGQFTVKRPEPLSVIAFRSLDVLCEPRQIHEEIRIAINGGIAPYQITWSGGNVSGNNRIMTTNEPGMYFLEIIDRNGCQYQESFEVSNSEVQLEADIQSSSFELYGNHLVNFEIQFINKSIGPTVSYYWDFGDGNFSFDENPNHTYLSEGEYEITLTVTDIYGCETNIKKTINVFDYYLVVPNVFTPNGDGVNDYFFPQFLNIEKIEFWVLNKWGEMLFYTDDLQSDGWDGLIQGKPAIPGNYVYKLSFQTLDGRNQIKTEVFLLLK